MATPSSRATDLNDKHAPEWLNDADLEALPLERATTIPATWYTLPAVFEFEQRQVFANSWQLAGEAGSLKSPGDYRVEEIAGGAIIVLRDKQGELRAFHNVCRHRAGPVAAGSGNCKILRCRYHGWVYRLDGSLHTAPEIGEVEDFDPAAFGLVPLSVTEESGMLYVARKQAAKIGSATPAEMFAGIRDRVGQPGSGPLKYYRRDTYEISCNWKAYVDNYLEGYHLPLVHPELSKILDYQQYTTEVHDGYSLQHSEIAQPTAAYNPGQAYYYFIFPNIMLNILPGRMQTNVVLPTGPDHCRVVFDYYYEDTSSAAARSTIEEDIRFGDLVQKQDIDICEQVQKGLASGVYERGRLSAKRELGVHHFQNLLRSAYRRAI